MAGCSSTFWFSSTLTTADHVLDSDLVLSADVSDSERSKQNWKRSLLNMTPSSPLQVRQHTSTQVVHFIVLDDGMECTESVQRNVTQMKVFVFGTRRCCHCISFFGLCHDVFGNFIESGLLRVRPISFCVMQIDLIYSDGVIVENRRLKPIVYRSHLLLLIQRWKSTVIRLDAKRKANSCTSQKGQIYILALYESFDLQQQKKVETIMKIS